VLVSNFMDEVEENVRKEERYMTRGGRIEEMGKEDRAMVRTGTAGEYEERVVEVTGDGALERSSHRLTTLSGVTAAQPPWCTGYTGNGDERPADGPGDPRHNSTRA